MILDSERKLVEDLLNRSFTVMDFSTSSTAALDNMDTGSNTLELGTSSTSNHTYEYYFEREKYISAAFGLPLEEKQSQGVFRKIGNLTQGYKVEGSREFFETRLNALYDVSPTFTTVKGYDECIHSVFSILHDIGKRVLTSISLYFNLVLLNY
jgi:hypothetical protein